MVLKGWPNGLFEKVATEVTPVSGRQRDWSGASASRVHKALLSDRVKPRVFIFKLLRYTDRELILRPARLHVPVKTSDGATLSFFPDLCSAFVPIRKEMREAGIQNYLLYPATLKVILNQGEPKMLHSPEEAGVFLRSHSSTNSQWTSAGRAV